MLYDSTRGQVGSLSSAEVIKAGIASDGGLFVPREIPRMSIKLLEEMAAMSYQDRAKVVLQLYLSDYSAEEIA